MYNYSVLTTVCKSDNPDFLKQSIESMLKQTVITNDYVIVQDGPITEELENVLQNYSSLHGFFNIIKLEKNGGLGVALNIGLKECRNELIARLDSDDISLPNRCEIQIKEFEKDPELAIIGTDMYEFDKTIDAIKDLKEMPCSSAEIYKYGKRRNPFNHSSVMYRKSVILAVGNYSSIRRSQDVELWSRIIYKGYKTKNISQPLIYFRTNGIQRLKRKRKWANVKSDINVFKQNYKMGYSSLLDYMFVCIYELAFYLIPENLAEFLYKKLFRTKV